jgi:hypothetical protein
MNRTAEPIETMTQEAIDAANARLAAAGVGGRLPTAADKPPITAATAQAALDNVRPSTRATPVRGTCCNCGKHHSRHYARLGRVYCKAYGASTEFALERPQPEQVPIYIELPALRFDVSTVMGRDMLSHLVASGANFGSGMDWAIMEQLLNHIDRLSEGTRTPEAK